VCVCVCVCVHVHSHRSMYMYAYWHMLFILQISSVRTELEQLQQLRHPHLVQYLEMKDHISDTNTITVEVQ